MNRHIRTLTGLRGLAALIVFISHSANLSLLPAVLGRGFGQIGVILFFMLSGFLMTHLYVMGEFSVPNVTRYALARVGRVFPLYFVILVLSIIVSNFVFEDFYFKITDLPTAVFAFGFVKAPYVFWTIPVEVQFYCIFVIFWWLHQKGASRSTLAVFAVLTHAPSLVFWLMTGEILPVISSYSFSFFVGVATAYLYGHAHRDMRLRSLANYMGFPLLILLFVNLPQLRQELGLAWSNRGFLNTWVDPITLIIVYGVFVSALFNSRGLAFLNWWPFAFLGQVSYGFYLIHQPILTHLSILEIDPISRMVLALFLTCLLAYLSYRYFERPIGRRIRQIRMPD